MTGLPGHDSPGRDLMLCVLWQLEPALAALEEVMEGLKQHLDARVYVALGRGLWDCNARDVFTYVEALQEGRENRVRLWCCPCTVRKHAQMVREVGAAVGVWLIFGQPHVCKKLDVVPGRLLLACAQLTPLPGC